MSKYSPFDTFGIRLRPDPALARVVSPPFKPTGATPMTTDDMPVYTPAEHALWASIENHTERAALIFRTQPERVTRAQRQAAKMWFHMESMR